MVGVGGRLQCGGRGGYGGHGGRVDLAVLVAAEVEAIVRPF